MDSTNLLKLKPRLAVCMPSYLTFF